MSENPEHHNHFLDALVELVGQDRAKQAIALSDRARAHTASLIREAAEAVDPGPDQTEALEASKVRVAELETALDEATAALVRRGHEIDVLNTIIADLKAPAELKPASKK